MAIRAVIFDRDGVLTYFDLVPAMNIIGLFPGITFDQLRRHWADWYATHETPKTTESERNFLSKFWEHVVETWSIGAETHTYLKTFDYLTMIRAFDDARPTLITLRRQGLKIGVLSNFPLPSIEESLVAAGLADLVDAAASAPVIGFAKPAAHAYLHMTRKLGIEPHEALMVDDKIQNVEGARAIGMQALLLLRNKADSISSVPGLEAVVEFIKEG
ncbi:MAG TPA: HAD family hydrolase [Polyangium sp.]|nr:HAD family hydrolase [Polyangium sp.]